MHDLTTGPVTRHLLETTGFMLVTMVTQTLHVLVDLYWVGSLGKESVAAVGVAGNLTFIVLGLSQMLRFAIVALGAALRGIGNFRPGMIVSTATVVLNMVLAPVLIFGWGTGHAFGVTGAAMSSLVAIAVGVVWLTAVFIYSDSPLRFDPSQWPPRLAIWKQVLTVGLPPGVEFGLGAVYLFVVYTVSRPFGAEAQAGFGIGMRVIQAGFMPVVALGFAVAPVAGQNVGVGREDRVREIYRVAAGMAMGVMLAVAIICQVAGHALMSIFSSDPGVILVGDDYLHIMSWTFVASGWIFVASSLFQALGNTVPPLLASLVRILVVAVPVFVMARRPDFTLQWIWYLSAGSIVLQLVLSLTLLRREFRRRFGTAPATAI